MNKKLKQILIISGIILFGLIVWRITAAILKGGQKGRSFVIAVETMPLKLENVLKVISFTGTVEGDPQVKVYPSVSGKFWGNNVKEGSWVEQNADLAFINRDVVGMNYQPASIRSPIAGVVKRLYFVDRGAAVALDKPIAEIADPRSVKVILNVGEEELSSIKAGAVAIFTTIFDTPVSLTGTIASVTPFVDSETFSGTVVARAPNPSGTLKIGSTVNVDLAIGQAIMFMVPQQAVLSKLDKTYIFINNNGIAKEVTVVQGYVQDDKVEIKGDLKEGDNVVVQGAFKLSEGTKIQTGDSKPAGGPNQGGKPDKKKKSGEKPQPDNAKNNKPMDKPGDKLSADNISSNRRP